MASGAQIRSNGQPRARGTSFGLRGLVWLRLTRAMIGLALLVAAWGAIMLALLLGSYTLGAPLHRQIIVRAALYVAGVLGTLWLGVVALGCLIVGSFCLMLALTARRW